VHVVASTHSSAIIQYRSDFVYISTIEHSFFADMRAAKAKGYIEGHQYDILMC